LLCDEPVSALDLAGRHALIERLRTVRAAEAIPMLYVTHSPAEAIALGDRLFLLVQGTLIAEGSPLDVLTRPHAGFTARLEGLRNIFAATIDDHGRDEGQTALRLVGGPPLVVPHLERPAGTRVTVAIRADDIVLARGPIDGLSARNIVAGTIERIVPHAADAEVVVRTGELGWIVSVVASAVSALGLSAGSPVHMIVKARSCHVLDADEPIE
jgi:molybdate transport system ATP-binding protein